MTETNCKDLDGTFAVVTGCTSGTGFVTARELAKAGATVTMVCRNRDKAAVARDEITALAGHTRVETVIADLGEMDQVRLAASEIVEHCPRVDILVNNAGAVILPRQETSQGLEATFAGNYLGHFLLTGLLLDKLRQSTAARVVNLSSTTHHRAKLNLDDLQSTQSANMRNAYGQSKLAMLLFTYELADRLEGTGITVNAVHPGAVSSGFAKNLGPLIRTLSRAVYAVVGISPDEGADTILYLACSPEVAGTTGKYFIKRRAVPSKGLSNDVTLRKRLWDASEQLLASLPEQT